MSCDMRFISKSYDSLWRQCRRCNGDNDESSYSEGIKTHGVTSLDMSNRVNVIIVNRGVMLI